jgi:hypothetical protein
MATRKSSRKRDGRFGQLAGRVPLDMDGLEQLEGAFITGPGQYSLKAYLMKTF